MATNGTQSQQASGNTGVRAAVTKEPATRMDSSSAPGLESPRKISGYGLPCAKCHLYYSADLDVCPTCKHKERIPPVVAKVPSRVAQAVGDPIPDTSIVEQEREEFLRQFKSQLLEAHAKVANDAESVCKFAEHHSGDPAPAEICQACYERLQERVDIFEAALHLDLKEAARIVYDAVWADASDPGKTYQNAANALLSELRKRAGMATVLGPFQPLSH
ncbi:MAG TPA: hypothetical protein VIH75_02980 [Candidatus Sulfotelmatobacter sp.]|jgi:hypothetical protein